MFLNNYFKKEANTVVISCQQASDFAKNVAGDLNPIHDVNAKRFCVPGDLLFALVLNEYGLSQQMTFNFNGMVGGKVKLLLPENPANDIVIMDEKEKCYLSVSRQGGNRYCEQQLTSFIKGYVAFSGLNFSHALLPLMQEHGVMVNHKRPLVIYESMGFDLETLAFETVDLVLVDKQLTLDGNRGNVLLSFSLLSNGEQVGTGTKKLVLSGLRPYDEAAMSALIAYYHEVENR